jgi:hypothetical protein
MGNGNWEHFGKFKSISAIPTSSQGNDVVWNTIVASGSSVAIQGGPGLNPDGSPADGPIVLAHSFARQWGDKTAYHVGANYAEQEGDTIVVSTGNSSTKRTGWANNLNDGISFATTTGGSFATTLGFSVNTIVGGRVQTFIGIEANFSEAFTFKCAGGFVQEMFKTSRAQNVWLEDISLIGTATKICTSLKETLGSCRRVSLSEQSVAGEVSEQSLSQHVVTGSLTQDVASIDTKCGTKIETQASLTSTTVGDLVQNVLGCAKLSAIVGLYLD